jgi:hypothetical protein
MLIKSNDKLLAQFRVIANNPQDRTYFVENMTLSEYFWCYAEQKLTLGQKVDGEVKPPQHPEDYPVLIIY